MRKQFDPGLPCGLSGFAEGLAQLTKLRGSQSLPLGQCRSNSGDKVVAVEFAGFA